MKAIPTCSFTFMRTTMWKLIENNQKPKQCHNCGKNNYKGINYETTKSLQMKAIHGYYVGPLTLKDVRQVFVNICITCIFCECG